MATSPPGPRPLTRVIRRFAADPLPLQGRFLAVAGNLAALARGRRFLNFDLNRCWSDASIERVRRQDPARDVPEEREMRALLDLIDEAESLGPFHFLDLHTTSGASAPFALIGDTRRNRRLAFALPGPVVLGLEETIDGTLLGYLEDRGHAALVVEAGKHDDPRAVDLHESVIWLTLVSAGLLEPRHVPDYDVLRRRLADVTRGLPRVVDVRYRHHVEPENAFRMEPGYAGFQVIDAGEALARDRNGAVRAPVPGRLLMPLYQDQGNDGFFLVRPVRRLWLALSSVLRVLRLGILLRAMPGVGRHPERKYTLRVNPKVARFFPVEIFHLFGYRRRRAEGGYLVFARRRQT